VQKNGLCILVSLLAVACADSGQGDNAEQAADWSVDYRPTVAIGGADEREDYQLFRVSGATRLTDGRVVVANGGTSELRYYSPDGQHLETAGGEGEGPGELRGVMQIVALPGDTLLVLSFRPGLSWYDPDGEFVRSTRVDFWSVGGVECRIGEGNWHVLEDGSLLTLLEDNFYGSECPPTPPSPWRQSGLIGRTDLVSGVFDTLAIMPATERNSPNYRVFGESLLMTWGGGAVYATDTGSEEILRLGLSGDTLAIWRTPFDAKPVLDEAKTQSIREFERPDGSVERGNEYLYPDFYPRVGRLLLARTGDLWVMAYPTVTEPTSSWRLARASAFLVDQEGAEWRVLGQNGEVVSELRTPPGFFPLEVGEDYVLGLSRDELDLETVSVHALVR